MPTERLSMRKIRDVLRLKFESGLSERVIGRAMSLSNGSVNSYLQRARMAGLGWPLPDGLDEKLNGTKSSLIFRVLRVPFCSVISFLPVSFAPVVT